MDINQGITKRSEGLEMLRKIGSMLSRFDEAIVMHAFRESNQCADALVKLGCNLNSDLQIYSAAHNFIEQFLVKEVVGLHP